MNKTDRLFLNILGRALKGQSSSLPAGMTDDEKLQLFRLADAHNVLPIICDALTDFTEPSPAADKNTVKKDHGSDKISVTIDHGPDKNFMATGHEPDKDFVATDHDPDKNSVATGHDSVIERYRDIAVKHICVQIEKNARFLERYDVLRKNGISPLVVKGLVCMQLYPKPYCRLSTDEDLLIAPSELRKTDQVLRNLGLSYMNPHADILSDFEVSYCRNPEYYEIHTSLFDPEDSFFGKFNRCFDGIHERAVSLDIDGFTVLTPCPTDHLLFLLLHAFKHFLYSGFGVRQVCDISLFAERYGREIDWDRITAVLKEAHAEDFAAAIFRIGTKYLSGNPIPDTLLSGTDEGPLLEDILSSGSLGANDMNRLHSSSITLEAVRSGTEGDAHKGSGRLRLLFPPVSYLKARYPYLTRHPYLLPAAWAARLVHYAKDNLTGNNKESAAMALQIGKSRTELLRKYHVIP
ncbi:MAG: nucleotidyltransferase family protein [Chordicoccus sp.]